MRKWVPYIGIAVGIAIAVYALFFSSTEEDRIRAVLDRLADTVAVTPDDTNVLIRGAHIRGEFKEIFTKDVSFDIPELTDLEGGRDELGKLATIAPKRYRTARVDLGGLDIDLDQGLVSAVAYGEAVLTGTLQSGEPQRDTRTVSIRLDKVDGDWRIVSLSASETLE